MRIIAGSLRGRRLATPAPGERQIRPTADRAREALFSILQRWPTGSFLDLCAGTGAVAVEAWSRGYDPVISVEFSPLAFPLLETNARGTGIRVVRRDIRKLDTAAFRDIGILFADPPYEAAQTLWQDLAPAIRAWLALDGLVVWETGAQTELPVPAGFREAGIRRYGAACFHFFELSEDRMLNASPPDPD